jgi:hypothetical protein
MVAVTTGQSGVRSLEKTGERVVTVVNVTPGGVGGLTGGMGDPDISKEVYNLFDLIDPYQADFLINNAVHQRIEYTHDWKKGERYLIENNWEEVKPEVPTLQDGQLLVGICRDKIETQHMFKLVFPNKVQRLHDDEWATIGTSGTYDFATMSLQEVADAIRGGSDRFNCYNFFIPKGLEKPVEDDDRPVKIGDRFIGRTRSGAEETFEVTKQDTLMRESDGYTERFDLDRCTSFAEFQKIGKRVFAAFQKYTFERV